MACVFSPCWKYRYTLGRQVEGGRGTLAFVMLNPSTADDTVDDPTVRRCLGYARDLGFGQLQIANLYAWRSRDPYDLLRVPDPVGPGNDHYLLATCTAADLVVCAWGAFVGADARSREVLALLRRGGVVPHALRQTRSGQPAHPLRLPATLRPFPLPVR
jgi:hypothetical protein